MSTAGSEVAAGFKTNLFQIIIRYHAILINFMFAFPLPVSVVLRQSSQATEKKIEKKTF